jgi:hypothetical protein
MELAHAKLGEVLRRTNEYQSRVYMRASGPDSRRYYLHISISGFETEDIVVLPES